MALLYALKRCGQRASWPWLRRDYRPLFPYSSTSNQTLSPFQLSWSPPRGLLSRSFINRCHRQLWHWIASSHTIRRRPKANRQEGGIKQTLDCGEGKLCFLLNQLGLVVSWDCDRANVYEGLAFQHLVGGCRFNNGCLFGYRLGEERLASHKLTHLQRWMNGMSGCWLTSVISSIPVIRFGNILKPNLALPSLYSAS